MKPVVIYSSKTGNTEKVAMAVQSALPEGTPLVAASDFEGEADYDLIFVGYWVDRGTADGASRAAMAKISGKMVATFSTLGEYPDSQHAKDSVANGISCLGEGCTVLGTFICHGAVSPEVQEWMKQFPEGHPNAATPERLERWEIASTHPDSADLENAAAFAREVIEKAQGLVAS